MTSPAARAGAVWLALSASHDAGDYIVQLDRWADPKGGRKRRPVTYADPATGRTIVCGAREGRAACTAHVLSYVATQGAALYATNRALRLGLTPRRAALALTISGATHYWIDRHAGQWQDPPETARGLVRLFHKAGKGAWLQRDPSAGATVDQALHRIVLAAAAVTAATPRRGRHVR
ncbi:hypothetical protein [Streptomyces sp. NBRC 109706]|uniref:hypothetical protein n=1 Tax=Streptomyces sp. NBRC 109706 TaxID=1550035 RepID=UPI00083546ED|nr:hypothetical protein [Streptomyces sp. NBRC 109706]